MERQFSELLKKYWGYDTFRPMQREAVESVARGVDTLVLMPTGGGKSLIYQLPTLASEGLCIVVTPLVALMKDQVDRLRHMGIQACAVYAGLGIRQIDILLDNCVYGDVKFLFIAPERIMNDTFRMRVSRMKVCLLAVDEAHCISQWGYDFRPSYLKIAELRRWLPGVPALALTASATGDVVADIQRHLEFGRESVVFRGGFARPNLSYSVRHTEDKFEQLLRIVRNVAGTGIVYVRLRETTEQVAGLLRKEGISAEAYNGGLPYSERTARQDAWVSGQTRIMVATNAFGMGIDKADVRFVAHYDLPDSPEAYYQEAGRAGRDGRRSYAVLLASPDEPSLAKRRFAREFPPLVVIRSCYDAIFNYLQVGIGEGKHASFTFNLYEFAGQQRLFSSTVLNAIKILSMNGYLTLTDEMDNPPRVMFIVSRDDLYKIRIDRGELDHFLRTVLRLYNGLFHDFVPIEEQEIAAVSGYTVPRVQELFKTLWQLRVIKYIPGNRSPLLFLNEERLPTADVRIAPESYEMRKRMAAERLEAMFHYAANETECRSVALQRYFGEENPDSCGVCDLCLARKKGERRLSGEEILALVAEKPLTVKETVASFRATPQAVIATIDRLLAEGKVVIDLAGRIVMN